MPLWTSGRLLTFGRSQPSGRSALRRSGVLLALGFLALALHAGLLVVLAAASLGEDSRLLDLLVEATQGALERRFFPSSAFYHLRIHLLGLFIWGRQKSELAKTRRSRAP